MRLRDFHLSPEILSAARRGERHALESFYRGCAQPAYTLIKRIVPGASAEDLLQEAFLDAFRALPDFDGRAPLGVWFRTIAVRRCLMHLRSPWQRSRVFLETLRRRPELDEAAPIEARAAEFPATSADSTGMQLDLERSLASLPDVTRWVVWLYDVEGYTHEEIARLFGRSVSFSKSQLARGHDRLRHSLGPDGAAEIAPCAALKM